MENEKTFTEIMDALVAECESVLKKYLPDPRNMPEGEQYASLVAQAMQYSAMAGGKRLRPLLIARICDMYGGRRELAEPFMAALEMIHNYSLVHDDLPAMDDDDYRRGRKTTHIVFGEGMAVLAGDALLNFAYETAVCAFSAARTPAETAAVIRSLKILAKNAGIYGMVGGQCADLEAENRQEEVTGDMLQYIHSHKTACLIDSGYDILDVIGDSAELGKPVGSDEEEGKTTYVTLYGLDQASRRVQELSSRALEEFDKLSVRDGFLRELILRLVSRRK